MHRSDVVQLNHHYHAGIGLNGKEGPKQDLSGGTVWKPPAVQQSGEHDIQIHYPAKVKGYSKVGNHFTRELRNVGNIDVPSSYSEEVAMMLEMKA